MRWFDRFRRPRRSGEGGGSTVRLFEVPTAKASLSDLGRPPQYDAAAVRIIHLQSLIPRSLLEEWTQEGQAKALSALAEINHGAPDEPVDWPERDLWLAIDYVIMAEKFMWGTIGSARVGLARVANELQRRGLIPSES